MTIALAIIAAVAELAVAPATTTPVVVRPTLVRPPTGEEMTREYPARARLLGLSGSATLQCRVTLEETLSDCITVDEKPPNLGIGSAATRLARYMRLKPQTVDGKPVDGGMVRIPLGFRLESADAVPDAVWARSFACYGQTAKLAEEDPLAAGAWAASLYWTALLSLALTKVHGRPSDLEAAQIEARSAAEAGTPIPAQGADLKSCIAEPAKK